MADGMGSSAVFDGGGDGARGDALRLSRPGHIEHSRTRHVRLKGWTVRGVSPDASVDHFPLAQFLDLLAGNPGFAQDLFGMLAQARRTFAITARAFR